MVQNHVEVAVTKVRVGVQNVHADFVALRVGLFAQPPGANRVTVKPASVRAKVLHRTLLCGWIIDAKTLADVHRRTNRVHEWPLRGARIAGKLIDEDLLNAYHVVEHGEDGVQHTLLSAATDAPLGVVPPISVQKDLASRVIFRGWPTPAHPRGHISNLGGVDVSFLVRELNVLFVVCKRRRHTGHDAPVLVCDELQAHRPSQGGGCDDCA